MREWVEECSPQIHVHLEPQNVALLGTLLGVQWLRLCASTAVGTGLIPGREGRIRSHMPWGAAERLKKK